MTEFALGAVYKGIDARLAAAGGVFGTRVRVSVVPANFAYPYVVQFWQGGGEANAIIADDAEFKIAVKCVSTKLADAIRGAATIHTELNNKGESESPSDFVYGGSDWVIQTITAEETIFISEQVSDSEIVYHVGNSYRLALARRA